MSNTPLWGQQRSELFRRIRSEGRYARIEHEHPPDADGWIKLSMDFEEERNACEYVIGFGPHIEVVEPQALRERVIRLAESVVAFYARRAQTAPASQAEP